MKQTPPMKQLLPALLVGSVVLLGGCGWIKSKTSKKENIAPPKALAVLAPTLDVQRVWEATVGDGAKQSGVRIGPAVVDGKLYAASVDGVIAALDAASGKTLWRTKTKLAFAGGPAVDGGVVVAGTLDGEVAGYDAGSGAERWTTTVSSEVISAPAMSLGTAVVRANDGHLYGLDANDGSRKWTYDRTSVPLLSLRGNGPPLIDGSVVYDGADSGKILALRLDNGGTVWEQRIGLGEGKSEVERLSDADGTLVLDGGVLYVAGYRGAVMALAANLGRPQWTRELSSYTGVAVSASQVYAVDADSNVWALDRASGSSMWKSDAFLHRWLSEPAAQGQFVVVGDIEGYVHWLAAADGKEVARHQLSKAPIRAKPVVIGDTVYVEDEQGRIGAYRAAL
jgi:outer membrane protein assembly factor BamB